MLHTGPIAIRGVGRATRDFFRPDKVSKHRLTEEEREAGARAADQDATDTEQLDSVDIASAIEAAGGDLPPGPSPDLDEGNSGVTAGPIPVTWVPASAVALPVSSGKRDWHRGRVEPKAFPVLEFPTALDAAALAELQRLVLERAQAAQTEHGSTDSLGQGGPEQKPPLGAFGEPTDAPREVPLAGTPPTVDAVPREGSPDVAPAPSDAEAQNVSNSFANPLHSLAEIGPASGEHLDRAPTSDDAGTVDEAAPPDEEEPRERSAEAADDERRQEEGVLPPAGPGGDGIRDNVRPLESSDGAELEQLGATDDDRDADTPANPPEPDEHSGGDRALGLVDEEIGAETSVTADRDASQSRTPSAQPGEEDSPATSESSPAGSQIEQSEPGTTGPDQADPADGGSSGGAEATLAEVPEQPTEAPPALRIDDDVAADAEPALEVPEEGARLDSPESSGLDTTPMADSEACETQPDLAESPERVEGSPSREPIGEVAPEALSTSSEVGGPPHPEEPSPGAPDERPDFEIAPDLDSAKQVEDDELVGVSATEAADPGRPGLGREGKSAVAGESRGSREDDADESRQHRAVPFSSGSQSEEPDRFRQGNATDSAINGEASSVPPTEGMAGGRAASSSADTQVELRAPLDQAEVAESEPVPTGTESVRPETSSRDEADVSAVSNSVPESTTPDAAVPEEGRAVERETAAPEPSGRNPYLEPSPGRAPRSGEGGDLRSHEPAVAAALAAGLRPPTDAISPPQAPPRRQRARPGGQVEASQAAARERPARAPRAPRPPRPPRIARVVPDGGGWTQRLWSYIALTVLALVCAAAISAVIVKTHNDATIAAKEAASYTAPPLNGPSPAPSPSPVSTLPVVSVVGDDLTAGSSSDSGTKSEWPALLASALHADVKTIAARGAGYVTKGAGGVTLVSEAAQVDPASTVVVLFGGGNDVSSSPVTVATAATKAISAVRATAPKAEIVVVGPASSLATPSPALLAIRDSLRASARIGNADWQDPIAGNWLSSSSSLTTGSGVPNDQGEKAIESKLESALRGFVQG